MTYKIMENGVVVNTIESDTDFVKVYCESMGYTFELVDETPALEPEQTPDVWDELAAAIREGVNDV